ncbi:hypothetical protein SNARM312S_04355 [Streptomyces narbonensis]
MTRARIFAPAGEDPDYVTSWPVHCVAGTRGPSASPTSAPAVASGAIDSVFDKGAYDAAYSGFEGLDENGRTLAEWLRERDVTEVDVVGIATDHCVRATALDAAREGVRTDVLLDLTAGVREGDDGEGPGGAHDGGRGADRRAARRGPVRRINAAAPAMIRRTGPRAEGLGALRWIPSAAPP